MRTTNSESATQATRLATTTLGCLLAICLAATGCGGGGGLPKDTAPDVLGFTPEVRQEMRRLIADHRGSSPAAADVEQVVKNYMDKLRGVAHDLEVKPDANGNLVLPQNLQEGLDKAMTDENPTKTLDEFELSLPDWAQPLRDEATAGTLQGSRKKLLVLLVFGELIPQML